MHYHILGQGFIGTRIRDTLVDSYSEVTSYSARSLLLQGSNIEFSSEWQSQSQNSLIWTAWITRTRSNDPETRKKNTSFTEQILRKLEKKPPCSLVYLSSVDVYGTIAGNLPFDELSSTAPADEYSKGKLEAEQLILKHGESMGYPVIICRMPGVYGAGDRGQSAIGRMVTSAIQTNSITITGSGVMRDFLYADDLGRLMPVFSRSKESNVVNVASGNSLLISQIAELIQANINPAPSLIQAGSLVADNRLAQMKISIVKLSEIITPLATTSIAAGIRSYITRREYE